jgi:hypothetical protein
MLLEAIYKDKCEPEDWDLWRASLEGMLISMFILRDTVAAISVKYYGGHPLLFAEDKEKLNGQIAYLEALKTW